MAPGPTPRGRGTLNCEEGPTLGVPFSKPTTPDERYYGTTTTPNVVERAAGVMKHETSKEQTP